VGMTVLPDLHALDLEHRRCGELDTELDGDYVWMCCTCGSSGGIRMIDTAWDAELERSHGDSPGQRTCHCRGVCARREPVCQERTCQKSGGVYLPYHP
jgi:hypothetical protein